MSDPKDIESVRWSEETRNPHYDEEKAKRTRKTRRGVKKILQSRDIAELDRAIRALGRQPWTEEYEEIVQIWKLVHPDV